MLNILIIITEQTKLIDDGEFIYIVSLSLMEAPMFVVKLMVTNFHF
jgi:hypothetical protein